MAIPLAGLSADDSSGDSSVIREIQAYVEAFNAEDAAKVESMWAENATHMDHELNQRTDGRAAIMADIAAVFDLPEPVTLSGSVDNVRMVTDSVASIDGKINVTVGDFEPTTNKFSAILTKQDEKWVIDSMEEMSVPSPVSAAAALSKLDWLIGSWQDASGEMRVRCSVKRAIGGSFLVRSFEASADDEAVAQSTQVIGWDPRLGQFRSWTFDADGSFGEGVWSENGGQWLIKSAQVLADGQTASGTFVMTPQDSDHFAIELIGRTIEGELQPSSPEVTVSRVGSSDEADDSTTTTEPSSGQ
ncbi:YybH family protein [Novipirellula artificiosorum]|nr:nuclear transport factor 2 family protein [Novipirellula artificiosorum]